MSMMPSLVWTEVLVLVVLIIVWLAAVWYLADKYDDNKCNQDCNQGRNCNCRKRLK